MARLSQNRVADIERHPRVKPFRRTVISEFITEVNGTETLCSRAFTLPRRHLYASVTLVYVNGDENYIESRIWERRKYSPPSIAEYFDPPILADALPDTLDINAAIRWRVASPREWQM